MEFELRAERVCTKFEPDSDARFPRETQVCIFFPERSAAPGKIVCCRYPGPLWELGVQHYLKCIQPHGLLQIAVAAEVLVALERREHKKFENMEKLPPNWRVLWHRLPQ